MSSIQCPYCFEHIKCVVDVQRNFQLRRCPRAKSSPEAIEAGLSHCYCQKIKFNELRSERYCCRCGDKLKVALKIAKEKTHGNGTTTQGEEGH